MSETNSRQRAVSVSVTGSCHKVHESTCRPCRLSFLKAKQYSAAWTFAWLLLIHHWGQAAPAVWFCE